MTEKEKNILLDLSKKSFFPFERTRKVEFLSSLDCFEYCLPLPQTWLLGSLDKQNLCTYTC